MRAALLALIACSSTESLPAVDLAAERFTTRGRVTKVHAAQLEIHHERIAQIRTFEGKLEPMEPMTMVFSATANASIDGFAVGDAVKIEFTVSYKQPPPLRLVTIEKLPAGTKLEVP
jgi:Cu/Ag efflux protein CusF